jgi:hypothetical protein
MKRWFREYCLNDKNYLYITHAYLKKINEDYLYDLRCSIVHAFALPEYKGKFAVMIPNGVETALSMKKIHENFEKSGLDPVFISSDSLMSLFIKGFTLLHEQIFVHEDNVTSEVILGMKRIDQEFNRRGAKTIKLL